MVKIANQKLLKKLSIFSILSVALMRPYIIKVVGFSAPIVFTLLAIVLLFITIPRNKKIIISNKNYIIISFLYLIPFFYNNAYIIDGKITDFLCHILTIVYFILFFVSSPDEDDIKFAFKVIIGFAILTAIASWIGFLFPNIYTSKIIPLLPSGYAAKVYRSFPRVNAGLTDHYSRNALYITLGVMSLPVFILSNTSKSKKILLFILAMIFVCTLYLIGKRGHLLFLFISFIITYIIYKRLSIKTIAKLILIIILLGFFTYLAVKFIPGVDFFINRIIKKSTSSDISTGRFEMYEYIFNLYKENGNFPIGWGQYARSTGYFHPFVHNDYIQLICEVGIFGFINIVGIDLLILFKNIKYTRKSKSSFRFTLLIYNIFFLSYAITGTVHYDISTNIFYFMTGAILFILYYTETKIKEKGGEKNDK